MVSQISNANKTMSRKATASTFTKTQKHFEREMNFTDIKSHQHPWKRKEGMLRDL